MQTSALPGVTLTGGAGHWQIYQQDDDGTAVIAIEGTWNGGDESSSVQARIVDEITNAPAARHLDWQDTIMQRADNRFSISFPHVPRGGLYRIETRVRIHGGLPLRGDCVHHIGVGDLFIIAGQSNASGTGKGAANDGPMLGVHLFGNDEQWRIATHPLEDASGTLHPVTITGIFHGHSPWLAFGKRYFARAGTPVGLIPTALGGSPISEWIQDDGKPAKLFENMADMAQKTGGKVAGVLWYQGESDTEADRVEAYHDRFVKLADRMRRHLQNDTLPILTAQLNIHLEPDPPRPECWSRIREIQRSLTREIHDVYLVVTVDCPVSDVVHNNAAANMAIGERFADTALEALHGFSLTAHYPDVRSVRMENRRRIAVEFDFVSGDWTPISRVRDFTVMDDEGIIPIRRVEVDTDNRIGIELERDCGPWAMLHGLYGCTPMITLRDDGGRCITPFSVAVENA